MDEVSSPTEIRSDNTDREMSRRGVEEVVVVVVEEEEERCVTEKGRFSGIGGWRANWKGGERRAAEEISRVGLVYLHLCNSRLYIYLTTLDNTTRAVTFKSMASLLG